MATIHIDWITRKTVQACPDWIFLFGDNLIQKGMGGQAKECRGEPNAIGIPTKKYPNIKEDSYFTDKELELNKEILNKAFALIPPNRNVAIPLLGVGLAKLPEKAPKTYEYLLYKIKELEESHC